MNKNLKKTAELVVKRVLREDWLPAGKSEIAGKYRLDDAQAVTVIKYAKRIFRDKGIVWVYDRKFDGGRFRYAKPDNPELQKHLNQAAQEWLRKCRGETQYIHEAGWVAGFVTEGQLEEVRDLGRKMDKASRKVEKIGWNGPLV